jgi:hypothetical protein
MLFVVEIHILEHRQKFWQTKMRTNIDKVDQFSAYFGLIPVKCAGLVDIFSRVFVPEVAQARKMNKCKIW